jgi:hypothetical protein
VSSIFASDRSNVSLIHVRISLRPTKYAGSMIPAVRAARRGAARTRRQTTDAPQPPRRTSADGGHDGEPRPQRTAQREHTCTQHATRRLQQHARPAASRPPIEVPAMVVQRSRPDRLHAVCAAVVRSYSTTAVL